MKLKKDYHPNKKDLENFLYYFNNKKFKEAEKALKLIQNNFPNSYIFENLLGAVLYKQNNISEAMKFYKKSLKLNPNFAIVRNNIGIVLREENRFNESIEQFEKAINLDHDYIDAYQNLAITFRENNEFEKAIEILYRALKISKNNSIILRELGETLRGKGDTEKSIDVYLEGIRANPDDFEAMYQLGLAYKEIGQHELAIKYWSLCNIKDAKERILFSLYKLEKFKEFNDSLIKLSKSKNISRIVASLASHATINLKQENKYNFCKNPMDFVFNESFDYLKENNNRELNKLLSMINNLNISYRKQGLLKNGIQSAGNLFDSKDLLIQKLLKNTQIYLDFYKKRFDNQQCEFINSWPSKTAINGWFVIMNDGGHLNAHMHEDGWVSGTIYLSMPKKIDNQSGNIELSLHGGNLPKKNNNFDSKIFESKVGNIILFPSSLYHRTLPFSSSEKRICIAFDLIPI